MLTTTTTTTGVAFGLVGAAPCGIRAAWHAGSSFVPNGRPAR